MTEFTEKDGNDDGKTVTVHPEYEVVRWDPSDDAESAIATGFKTSKTAAELAHEAEDATIEAGEKAALVRATTKFDDKSTAGTKDKIDTGSKPGFQLASDAAPPSTTDTPHFNIKGRGWVTLKDSEGKTHKVRDDGNSIYIPGRPTAVQMQLVAQLSAEKGWDKVFVFNSSGTKLHPQATQLLSMQIGNRCCSDPKEAGKLHHHYGAADETYLNTLKKRHAAECASRAPAGPASP